MNNILIEFIPIFIIFLLLSYTKTTIQFSTTILGRCISIIIILFYSYIDILYGLLACFIIIIYYNSSYIEGMRYSLNIIEKSEMEKTDCVNEIDMENMNKVIDNDNGIYEIQKETRIKMDLENNNDFITENCHKGFLKYKNQIVKPEISQHIFPELNFIHEMCNPCDNTCNYTITDKKIAMEEKLIPKNSNEFYEKWYKIFS